MDASLNYVVKDEVILCSMECIREQMIKEVEQGRSLTDEGVVYLSQKLDVFLVWVQKRILLKKETDELIRYLNGRDDKFDTLFL